ncbi:LysR family transcriptional regulator [Desulfovibrio subterraneus]|uniref:LysR family transcriptional regulator n=1 Tax=Desulfovibrio subterraneus TaxID=2718620 RepID=A0A7J0BIT5_9BACT|nr:LysR family transcriptional regulator [Desulfovibrio subterraneus]WBF67741.1 LysR family transcriptional regulator [Desulfovibrio subterraneus]GFM33580.1 LysR family transcriptional regulator [Desulfovibrio subterraneus]
MELNQLRSFVCVAREQNLTRAARILHISQSALSTQIRGLEDSLGIILFERQARGMTLTVNGKTLLGQARMILDAAENMRVTAGKLNAELCGAITVGLNTDPLYLRMRALDARMEKLYPEISIEFITSQTMATTSLLHERVLDAGFRFGISRDEGISETFLTDVPLAVVIPTRFLRRVSKVSDFTWRSLAELPWLWTTCACPFHKLVADRMAEHGVKPHPVADALDEAIVREMVANGKGASILRRDMAELLEAEGLAAAWDEPLSVPLSIACLSSRKEDPLIAALIQEVRSIWAKS